MTSVCDPDPENTVDVPQVQDGARQMPVIPPCKKTVEFPQVQHIDRIVSVRVVKRHHVPSHPDSAEDGAGSSESQF